MNMFYPQEKKAGKSSKPLSQRYLTTLLVGFLFVLVVSCKHRSSAETDPKKPEDQSSQTRAVLPKPEPPLAKIPVSKKITVGQFFQFLDKIVMQYDTLSAYHLTENLLLRANPWIIDTLATTDYYYQMPLGNFVYNQKKMQVLKPGDTLLIPGPETAARLQEKMAKTWLDLNIPAFELRIMEEDRVLHTVRVRVGKEDEKYLEAAGHKVDLRTKTGVGEIIRVNRMPIFIDPVTGERFKNTKRDDRRKTLMPQIPWLEPSINGHRYGQMIHPTTNPRSLGKPISNGCIGTSEADAWRVYFYAPVGTKVQVRYDLEEINAQGDTIRYNDIYHVGKKENSIKVKAAASFSPEKAVSVCICDSLF